MTITNPIYTNALMKAGAGPAALQSSPDVGGNALMGQARPPMPPQPPVITPQQVQAHHTKLDDYQHELKQVLKTPDEDLTMSKVFGLASDMITKHKLTGGKHGASAMDIAKELASPDMPKQGPNGEAPAPQQIRQFLLNHFNRAVGMQAKLTSKFGPPQQQIGS